MPSIHRRRGWEIPERLATPEALYWNRREFLRAMGLGSIGAAALLAGCGAGAGGDPGGGEATPGVKNAAQPSAALNFDPASPGIYPAARNATYTLDRALTDEKVAAAYNNFYEFTTQKDRVWRMTDRFRTRPWRIEVAGLVEKETAIDVDDLVKTMPVEERTYRHRCVEAWAMAVPWTGFPMKAFIDWAEPSSGARFVRMVSFLRPDEAPGQAPGSGYPWPYFEALRMEEAMNELAFLVIGIYGHPLPKQHGAPIRLATPWKYGYKSAKSIVRFEFTSEQPPTFWNTVAPSEYGFLSNVNPKVPHARWSQATERLIDTGEVVKTQPFNGYGEYVARLYR